jgi:hypothetical protein
MLKLAWFQILARLELVRLPITPTVTALLQCRYSGLRKILVVGIHLGIK